MWPSVSDYLDALKLLEIQGYGACQVYTIENNKLLFTNGLEFSISELAQEYLDNYQEEKND